MHIFESLPDDTHLGAPMQRNSYYYGNSMAPTVRDFLWLWTTGCVGSGPLAVALDHWLCELWTTGCGSGPLAV
eukprot:8998735-Pyramimonas_sp.AAC.1